jgi:hypothetical protein
MPDSRSPGRGIGLMDAEAEDLLVKRRRPLRLARADLEMNHTWHRSFPRNTRKQNGISPDNFPNHVTERKITLWIFLSAGAPNGVALLLPVYSANLAKN